MENDSYKREEPRVHLILFHRVWTPKRQKPVLTGDVSAETIQRYIEAKKVSNAQSL
jgi:hypothetical protein